MNSDGTVVDSASVENGSTHEQDKDGDTSEKAMDAEIALESDDSEPELPSIDSKRSFNVFLDLD